MNKGKIIVLEGLDGCGKSTQLEMTAQFLAQTGVDFRAVSFPDYASDSGRIVSRYLAGEIPCEGERGAYAASSFYAVDRYISFVTDWKKDYDRGSVILSGRYTTSNAIYQMTKIRADEREDYLRWLWEYEYNKLGLPAPELVIFLDMPVEFSQQLLAKRYEGDESKKDIHERSAAFQLACKECADFTAARCGWKRVECVSGDRLRPAEDIQSEIRALIRELVLHE